MHSAQSDCNCRGDHRSSDYNILFTLYNSTGFADYIFLFAESEGATTS